MSVSFRVVPTTPQLRFLASLSDGRTVIQDDIPNQLHAWFRLQNFLKENPGIKITALRIQNKDKEFILPSNQEGYAFGQQARGIPGLPCINLVGAGYLENGVVKMSWLNPERLTVVEQEEQTIEKCGFKLIRNI